MFNQACVVRISPLASAQLEYCVSCVESIYVGVSLQRSANEPLVSALEGGAQAMLPSYWSGMPEEIIFMVSHF